MTDATVSATLADFAASHRWRDVPEPTRYAARRTLLNSAALAVGAARHPAVRAAVDTFESLDSPPQAALLGSDSRLGLTAAPLVNGMAMHVEDYDDTHLPTVIHPGAPIVPAVLATAEHAGASGEETMAALTLGIEVALRVGNGVCPPHFDLGWHLTGTAGHIGAAVGASRVLGLPPEQVLVAMGLGATQASGFTEANGTYTKSLHPGKAAADGVEAALLAARGFTGPAQPIEGRRGFARTASPAVDFEEMLDDLGSRWEIEGNAFKPYACGIVSHPAIDAAVALRERVDVDDVESVEVRIPEVVLQVMGVRDPQDSLQSKFSVYHCVAVGLLDGAGGPPEFSDERARADDVVALRRKVDAVVDDGVPKGAAVLRVRARDGSEHEEAVWHATASAKRPMTDEQLYDKAHRLVAPVLGDGGAERLRAQCEQLDGAEDVSDLLAAARPAA